MNSQEILTIVQKIIAEALSVDPVTVQPEQSIRDDLGADSLDAIEVMMAIEEAFTVEFDEETAAKIISVGDLINHIELGLSVKTMEEA